MLTRSRALLVFLFLIAAFVPGVYGASNTLVISQIYGGGGNSGATLENDFIEILNISGSPISLNGFSVQYASAAGNFSSSNLTALPNKTLQPGHYWRRRERAAPRCFPRPTPPAAST